MGAAVRFGTQGTVRFVRFSTLRLRGTIELGVRNGNRWGELAAVGYLGMATGRTRISSPYLVGRDDELDPLTSMLDEAEQGRPATALVIGEAGIGKSRLVEEVSRQAGDRGFRQLLGACVHVVGGDLAYGPLVSVVGQVVKHVGVAEAAELAGQAANDLAPIAPALQLPDPPIAKGLAPHHQRSADARRALFAARPVHQPNAGAVDPGRPPLGRPIHSRRRAVARP